MNICPEAVMDDGLFEVCMVTDVSTVKFMKEISKVYSGRLGEIDEVQYRKGKEITIEVLDGRYLINIDGNLVGSTPVKIELVKNAIQVFI